MKPNMNRDITFIYSFAHEEIFYHTDKDEVSTNYIYYMPIDIFKFLMKILPENCYNHCCHLIMSNVMKRQKIYILTNHSKFSQ